VRDIGVIHPKGMPVILTNPEEIDHWMTRTPAEVLNLQRPLAEHFQDD
jgi:putative SOS response-associated peptidase YedK